MEDKLKKAMEILKKYNQEHLLYFYDELSEEEKNKLINQILTIDFDKILNIYKNSFNSNYDQNVKISPIPHIEKDKLSHDEINYYSKIGKAIIKNNEFAVVTMAGGQGTRLGYKGPKGTYMLNLKPVKKSLFQIMAENIIENNKKYNVILPWYIMTSEENDSPTKAFFEINNFFGYPKEKIKFFKQNKLPLINTEGKLILQEPYLIKEASNGNGNVFKSMKNNGIIDDLEKQNIKWISFGGIDNVLLKNFDPLFLGLTVTNNMSIGSKSIFKKEPLEKTAVYCLKNGKPAILDYDCIDLELSESKISNTDTYLFREANFKKNSFVNEEGVKQVPDKPNTFKFENFIFDAFAHFDSMLLLRVDENEEFAPIKDFTGIYNPDTAIEKYNKYYKI